MENKQDLGYQLAASVAESYLQYGVAPKACACGYYMLYAPGSALSQIRDNIEYQVSTYSCLVCGKVTHVDYLSDLAFRLGVSRNVAKALNFGGVHGLDVEKFWELTNKK